MENLKPGTTYAAVLGRVLAHHREESGMEQKELASKLNLGQSAWSRIERGDSVINVEQLRSVAEVFGVSANKLIAEADEAADALAARDVQVQTAKSMKNGNDAIALIGLAALTALVFAALSKK
ncbi:helix-turn-helix transcriptional regulator [Thalassospiraceae bacterium LMO-JJ14]|nr:helix-turn-helix transcriptional regulator [Thalassospiraceae bacterium LMO-JJ14]